MINMRKEYRAELRTLKKAERKLRRDLLEHQTRHQRACTATWKELAKIDRRMKILEGRLS